MCSFSLGGYFLGNCLLEWVLLLKIRCANYYLHQTLTWYGKCLYERNQGEVRMKVWFCRKLLKIFWILDVKDGDEQMPYIRKLFPTVLMDQRSELWMINGGCWGCFENFRLMLIVCGSKQMKNEFLLIDREFVIWCSIEIMTWQYLNYFPIYFISGFLFILSLHILMTIFLNIVK